MLWLHHHTSHCNPHKALLGLVVVVVVELRQQCAGACTASWQLCCTAGATAGQSLVALVAPVILVVVVLLPWAGATACAAVAASLVTAIAAATTVTAVAAAVAGA